LRGREFIFTMPEAEFVRTSPGWDFLITDMPYVMTIKPRYHKWLLRSHSMKSARDLILEIMESIESSLLNELSYFRSPCSWETECGHTIREPMLQQLSTCSECLKQRGGWLDSNSIKQQHDFITTLHLSDVLFSQILTNDHESLGYVLHHECCKALDTIYTANAAMSWAWR
jgi:hypothetical protein